MNTAGQSQSDTATSIACHNEMNHIFPVQVLMSTTRTRESGDVIVSRGQDSLSLGSVSISNRDRVDDRIVNFNANPLRVVSLRLRERQTEEHVCWRLSSEAHIVRSAILNQRQESGESCVARLSSNPRCFSPGIDFSL